MTTYISASYCATDAKRSAVEQAVAILTPMNTIGLGNKVCAIDPGVTWQTPATHWHGNYASIDADVVLIWQNAVAGTLPEGIDLSEASMTAQEIIDAMDGLLLWTAQNCTNATTWATTNLEVEGLMLVPYNPDP